MQFLCFSDERWEWEKKTLPFVTDVLWSLCVCWSQKTGVPKEACIRWEKDQFWGISHPVVKYRKSGLQSVFDVFVNYY